MKIATIPKHKRNNELIHLSVFSQMNNEPGTLKLQFQLFVAAFRIIIVVFLCIFMSRIRLKVYWNRKQLLSDIGSQPQIQCYDKRARDQCIEPRATLIQTVKVHSFFIASIVNTFLFLLSCI